MKLEVATIKLSNGLEKQITIDLDRRAIVEGSPVTNGRYVVCLRSGERFSADIKDGRITQTVESSSGGHADA